MKVPSIKLLDLWFALHPEGVFACQIVDFGDPKMSNSGRHFYMTATLKTSEGTVFTHMVGVPATLYAIRAATPFYATKIWQVKVKHRVVEGVLRYNADMLWERGGKDV